MEKFLKIKSYYLYMLIILGLTTSCADDPNSVGNALIPDEDKLNGSQIDSYTGDFVQSFSSFQKDSLYFGSSGRILLGSYKNITSEALLKFTVLLPDTIVSSIESNETTLKTSWVDVYPNYWIGDSANLNFSARTIGTSWTSIGLNADSLDLVKGSLGSEIMDSLIYEPGDTVLKMYFDNAVVDDWVKTTFDDSYPDNNGILLSPISNSGIFGFQALTTYPTGSFPILSLIFETSGELDTIRIFPSLDVHIPTGERLENPSNSILLQSSLNVRGKLKFDLSTVPTNALINSAILKLYVNENHTEMGTVETDTVAVSFYVNSSADSINSIYGKYPIVRNSESYSGEVRQFVQRWIDGEENEGIQVKLSDEARSASKVTFYGSDHPDATLRPRLTINYTIR